VTLCPLTTPQLSAYSQLCDARAEAMGKASAETLL
jgi:hypothetical protein